MPCTSAFGAREHLGAALPAAAQVTCRYTVQRLRWCSARGRLQRTLAPEDKLMRSCGGGTAQISGICYSADFRDVMDIAKSVFLALEHHNEAALRVAVEVVTDPIARECLWWTDFWFEDDDQRDQWKHIIWEKFPVVIGHATDSKPMVQTAVSADPAALEGMQQRVEQADTACKAAQQQKKIAEMRCRELEEMETKSREHVRALDESLAQMRAELRRSEEACTSVQQRLALQEEQLHEAEKHKAAAAQCLAEQEKCARAAEDSFVADKEKLNKSEEARAVVEEKLKKSEEARAVLEEKLKKGEEARAVLEEKSKAAEEKIKALQASASMNTPSKSDDKALHEIAGKFHAEKALMREIGMQTEFHVEKALMREIEMQSEELRRKTKEQDAEVSELRKANAGLEREVEELRATIPQKDNRIGKLHEDKAALEEEKMNMLSSIHALREKLKRITEIAEKRGCGKLVSEIMAEANIPQTLEGREFRCFERLYQDALRRQRNVRDRMQSMVSAGSPTLGAGVPVVQPQLRVGPSVTAEGYRFQRASSHLDLGGTGCVSTSPLPPGNAVLQRGSGHCYRQGADTVAGARASIVQPRPCNLGGQDAFRDFLQRGTSMRSSSIGRLLVRSSVSPVNQRSPAASTPTLPPTYLSFSRLSLRA